jgi:hypothetical protein
MEKYREIVEISGELEINVSMPLCSPNTLLWICRTVPSILFAWT